MTQTRQVMLFIVGTSHTIQIGSLEFKSFLDELCRVFNIRALAEEMSMNALEERGSSTTIPMQVASVLQIPHRLCDPNSEQRDRLGIHQVSDIRRQIFITNSNLSDSEILKRLEESNARRERHWLEQLRTLNSWPVLFVCGADHVASFFRLASQEGIITEIAVKDWEQ